MFENAKGGQTTDFKSDSVKLILQLKELFHNMIYFSTQNRKS